MSHHLVCVHPFGNYVVGQMVTNQDDVTKLLDDREQYFVRINAADCSGCSPEEAPIAKTAAPEVAVEPRPSRASGAASKAL